LIPQAFASLLSYIPDRTGRWRTGDAAPQSMGDVDYVTPQGKHALDLAFEYGHTEAVELLKDHVRSHPERYGDDFLACGMPSHFHPKFG
jgi:hypothetical protein